MFVTHPFSVSAPGIAQRGGLLAVVLGFHAVLLALMMTHKTILPKVMELPLVVDLIEAVPLPVSPDAAPGPAAPQPVTPPPAPKPKPKPKPAPRPQKKTPAPQPTPQPAPQLETTASTEPAGDSAPTAPAQEAAPEDSASAAAAGGGVGGGQGSAGSGLVQARFDANYLHNPAPPYPPMSRRAGEEGRVILRVRVSAAGRAEQVEIRTSSGSSRLDESARRTVSAWRFVPATRGGTPIESWVLVPIQFRLES